ncbi:hypothetical protein GGP41_002935 [Bipolaris sorokiniana]|uniref:Uncharacterized protein n=1 Tax=Cochliobolus sativus TaxID=45130 RepID=A0A8H5ZCH4_COCSA|nr:hypothetical protein GGP41_002935 [Bipolaris sorokiniana]
MAAPRPFGQPIKRRVIQVPHCEPLTIPFCDGLRVRAALNQQPIRPATHTIVQPWTPALKCISRYIFGRTSALCQSVYRDAALHPHLWPCPGPLDQPRRVAPHSNTLHWYTLHHPQPCPSFEAKTRKSAVSALPAAILGDVIPPVYQLVAPTVVDACSDTRLSIPWLPLSPQRLETFPTSHTPSLTALPQSSPVVSRLRGVHWDVAIAREAHSPPRASGSTATMDDNVEIPEESMRHIEALLARHPPHLIQRMFSQALESRM